MSPRSIDDLKAWFAGYVSGYYCGDVANDDNIRLKEEHTRRVCENIVHIAARLELSAQDICLSEAMALMHDIGRFKQYAVYQTFNDRISENHARLGLREIRKMRVLANVEKESRYLITKAIALHNIPALPPNLNRRTWLFAGLLRDADKLDIWRVFSEFFQDDVRQQDPVSNHAVTMGLPDRPECSKRILAALDHNKSAALNDIKTKNDYKLMLLSWVFDLNFFSSFQLLQKRRLLDNISATLPSFPAVRSAVDKALRHVAKSARKSAAR